MQQLLIKQLCKASHSHGMILNVINNEFINYLWNIFKYKIFYFYPICSDGLEKHSVWVLSLFCGVEFLPVIDSLMNEPWPLLFTFYNWNGISEVFAWGHLGWGTIQTVNIKKNLPFLKKNRASYNISKCFTVITVLFSDYFCVWWLF